MNNLKTLLMNLTIRYGLGMLPWKWKISRIWLINHWHKTVNGLYECLYFTNDCAWCTLIKVWVIMLCQPYVCAAGTVKLSWMVYSWHTKRLSQQPNWYHHILCNSQQLTLKCYSPAFLVGVQKQFRKHAAKRGTFTTTTSVHIFKRDTNKVICTVWCLNTGILSNKKPHTWNQTAHSTSHRTWD